MGWSQISDPVLEHGQAAVPADPLNDRRRRHIGPLLERFTDLRLDRVHDRALRRPLVRRRRVVRDRPADGGPRDPRLPRGRPHRHPLGPVKPTELRPVLHADHHSSRPDSTSFGNLRSARPIALPLDPVGHEEVRLLVQVRAREPQPPYPCLVCLLLSKVFPCALRERQFYTGSQTPVPGGARRRGGLNIFGARCRGRPSARGSAFYLKCRQTSQHPVSMSRRPFLEDCLNRRRRGAKAQA